MVAYSMGSYCAQIPVGDRKSGIPLSVETPAPVRTTHGCLSRTHSASCDVEMRELYIRLSLLLLAGLALAWPAGAQSPRRAGSSRVTVALPPGWHSTPPDQGNITNPLTRIVVSSGPIGPDLTSRCQSQPASYGFP